MKSVQFHLRITVYIRWLINAILSIVFCALLPLIVSTVQAKPQANKTQLFMGVFPHLPPRQIEKIFSPMAHDLGKTINRKIILRTSTTFERFSGILDTELFDIVFVQPFDYVRIADKYGYRPLAARDEKLVAILVVREDSSINVLQDLKKKKISLPPSEAAVSYLIRNHFKEHGLDPVNDVTLLHYRSHISCLQQVLIGEVDACGTAAPPLRFFQHRMKAKMRVIEESKEFPHSLFAIHPRVSEDERSIIRKRILSWSKTEGGKKLLEQGMLKPFVPAFDLDYDVIRKIAK